LKIAILADIHGNATALQTVLQQAKRKGVEQLYIAGDLMGYYFEPLKVLELLNSWSSFIVRGNHEDYLEKARTNNVFLQECTKRYGPGLEIALEQLNDAQLDTLASLPHPLHTTIENLSFLLCHGAPWNVDQYIYPDAESELFEKCAMGKYDFIILGHTHYPMKKIVGNTQIINPGSIGQPRNRQPGAHWILFDTQHSSYEFCCEQYDATDLLRACRQIAPDHLYLEEVLTRQ